MSRSWIRSKDRCGRSGTVGKWHDTFAPDGKILAFSHSTGKGTNILNLTLSDGQIQSLTSDDRSYAPLWGPRGIAFERFGVDGKGDRCGNCHGDVWLMNADGGNTAIRN